MNVLLVEADDVAAHAGVAVPAQGPMQNPAPPGQGEEFGKASPIALVVIVVLAIATILLIRSMSKRIRRLPPSFDAPARDETRHEAAGDATEDAGDGRA